jgi:hypothetical protein
MARSYSNRSRVTLLAASKRLVRFEGGTVWTWESLGRPKAPTKRAGARYTGRSGTIALPAGKGAHI